MMDNMKYYLQWEFGLHHAEIEVNKGDFFKVIDDMSKEFEITKLDFEYSYEMKLETNYYIQDYSGNTIKIGRIIKEV